MNMEMFGIAFIILILLLNGVALWQSAGLRKDQQLGPNVFWGGPGSGGQSSGGQSSGGCGSVGGGGGGGGCS